MALSKCQSTAATPKRLPSAICDVLLMLFTYEWRVFCRKIEIAGIKWNALYFKEHEKRPSVCLIILFRINIFKCRYICVMKLLGFCMEKCLEIFTVSYCKYFSGFFILFLFSGASSNWFCLFFSFAWKNNRKIQ